MKKFVLCLLAICMLSVVGTSLVSCKKHVCEFSDTWSKDKEMHWHACIDAACSEISDQQRHTWEENGINKKATQEQAGEKIYTCTVCGRDTYRTYEFVGMDRQTWNDIFSSAIFDNFTYTETTMINRSGIAIISETKGEFMDGKARLTIDLPDPEPTQYQMWYSDEATIVRKSMVESIRKLVKFEEYQYNEKDRLYHMIGEIELETVGVKLTTATVKFDREIPVEVKYTYTYTEEETGMLLHVESTVSFTKFGTTYVL